MKRKVGNRLTQISWRNGTSEEIRQRRGKERKKREEIGRGGGKEETGTVRMNFVTEYGKGVHNFFTFQWLLCLWNCRAAAS